MKSPLRIKPIVLTGTLFWVTTQTESLPRTPIEVIPAALTALNAYSVFDLRKTINHLELYEHTMVELIHSGDATYLFPQNNQKESGLQELRYIPT